MAPAGPPDAMLRAAARARGFRLIKSRRRKPGGDRGKYGLTAATGARLTGFGPDGLTASFEEIEDYLRRGEVAAWAGSVESAGGPSPSPRPARPARIAGGGKAAVRTRAAAPRPASPAPRPEPPLRVRRASRADARPLSALLQPIYPELDTALLARRLAARNGSALVAVKDGIVGVLAWATMPILQRGEVARIALIYVEERMRRRGIGTALLKAAEARMGDCDAIEAASDIEIRNAHRFFAVHGYARTSYRFLKNLRG